MNILLIGAYGKMGKEISDTLFNNKENKIVCGIDLKTIQDASLNEFRSYPVFPTLSSVPSNVNFDVILDFSSATNIKEKLEFAKNKTKPIVFAVTNISNSDIDLIKEYSKSIPVFLSSNFSYGIFIVKQLLKTLKLYDTKGQIDMIEFHHDKKTDSPSGTAKELAEIVRPNSISSIRSGTICGTHSIIFTLPYENIEIRHTAESKKIFALGAIYACEFIVNKQFGLFDTEDLYKK